ncbi:MBL fold metallo-hydrolase [Guptibacillus hwajinpoensis]|uniref:MBL fold metallo-hydrolase n=1 Tax=Guptibacillus hwajinpoensis TaxID=208199 RepID=UPI001CFEFCF1|nr:MBL fold metallo-hydrolase [Pseudalkalibacillus hwajinpoensis]WLR58891.1 MBL fold metallo-hydrolase [Pseudalkalibacillus hwajinpoensis]
MRIIKEQTVYQLSFMANWFPVNCYFVEEEESLTLIDAALSFSKNAILKAAAQIGKPINRIIITHAHTDHMGALDGLKASLPHAEILLPQRELKLLNGDSSLEPGEGDLPVKGGVPRNSKTQPDVLLKEGDMVGSLIAIEAPGHTPGMMAFIDKRNQILIASDALQTKGGVAVAGDLRWRFPFPALATWDKERAIATVEKLASFNPSVIGVGHGDFLYEPEALKRAILQAKKREEG